MTRTLKFSPAVENRLQVLAAQRGASVADVAVEVVTMSVMSEEEWDAILDERDAQMLATRVPVAAEDCYSLDDLRRAIGQ